MAERGGPKLWYDTHGMEWLERWLRHDEREDGVSQRPIHTVKVRGGA